MQIYLSIPISGHPISQQKQHADRVTAQLKSIGHTVVSPFDTTPPPADLDERAQYAWWLGEDIKLMLQCDAVFFCSGWEDSCGCRIEHETVMRVKAHHKAPIKVMYEY